MQIDKEKLRTLVQQYEEVYLFSTKRIESLMAEKIMVPMSIEQFGILRQLAVKGPLQPKEVATITGVHKSAVTLKADRLVSKGLVHRKQDEEDRRVWYLSLTEEGESVYARSEEAMTEFISSYLENLDPEEVEVFLNVYKKINRMMQDREEPPAP
ncbi:MarR family transcriptional regulator [Bacillus sp. H-16]|uniref:MarR family winged helix-turn-helix transcriptional regulator n=1 Tax=Alteribacter salitolerans TaxID=2912333 RepID=UPI00196541B1|nr:MarR family transcriptional regulator [Alteribacter salitolerans]MBM7096554.1 MarR family transcriptional regulator [Alteribacter salitolerans]